MAYVAPAMTRSEHSTRTARITRRALLGAGATAIGGTLAAGGGLGYFLYLTNRVGDFAPERVRGLYGEAHSPLLAGFPGLAGALPWVPLARRPRPVEALDVGDAAGNSRLYVKRDDRNAARYGGNKVRKLEHLLAEATLQGADTLVTMGGIGSNQALATALLGGAAGFSVRLSLFDHPVSAMTEDNLRGCLAAGAAIRYAEGIAGSLWNVHRIMAECRERGEKPYLIPAGASNRLGNVGLVNAGMELAEQVAAGELPEPDRVFVAAGTCGTAAGLLAGLRLAGLKTRVVAVRTAEAFVANRLAVCGYANDCLRYLRSLSLDIPDTEVAEADFELAREYLGEAYAVATPAAREAVAWAAPDLTLETTYTGKALAAALDYCRGPGRGQTVVFWNTFNSRDFARAESLDELPDGLRRKLIAAESGRQLSTA